MPSILLYISIWARLSIGGSITGRVCSEYIHLRSCTEGLKHPRVCIHSFIYICGRVFGPDMPVQAVYAVEPFAAPVHVAHMGVFTMDGVNVSNKLALAAEPLGAASGQATEPFQTQPFRLVLNPRGVAVEVCACCELLCRDLPQRTLFVFLCLPLEVELSLPFGVALPLFGLPFGVALSPEFLVRLPSGLALPLAILLGALFCLPLPLVCVLVQGGPLLSELPTARRTRALSLETVPCAAAWPAFPLPALSSVDPSRQSRECSRAHTSLTRRYLAVVLGLVVGDELLPLQGELACIFSCQLVDSAPLFVHARHHRFQRVRRVHGAFSLGGKLECRISVIHFSAKRSDPGRI